MNDLLALVAFDDAFAWMSVVFILFLIFVIPKFFNLNYFNGLLLTQITLFFNSTTIIAGLSSGVVSIERALHFFVVELSFFILVYAVYSYLLRYREQVLNALNIFFASRAVKPFVVIMTLIAIFNFINVPTDGSSRIEYMTAPWFSYVKPIIQLAIPLSYLGVFVLILNPNHRHLGYVLLLITVVGNVLTGSKASFSLGLFVSFLILRDLSVLKNFKIRIADKVKLSVIVSVMVLFALTRLEVSPNDIKERFFLFGEATILTYFSDTPTAACKNVSYFARMHRGFARVAGDASANDIETLFGYALMIEALGVNTFTGPNARISAYFLCNFPDESIFLGVVDVAIYITLLLAVFRRSRTRPIQLAIFYPFFLVSLAATSQDFNLLMQDIIIYIFMLVSTYCFNFKRKLLNG
jgi:hypothetical protein